MAIYFWEPPRGGQTGGTTYFQFSLNILGGGIKISFLFPRIFLFSKKEKPLKFKKNGRAQKAGGGFIPPLFSLGGAGGKAPRLNRKAAA